MTEDSRRDEYRAKLTAELHNLMRSNTPGIVEAPPGLGKTREVGASAVAAGESVTILVGRNENKIEVADACRDRGLGDQIYTLPDIYGDCPAAPEDPSNASTPEEKKIVTLREQGATNFEIHKALGENLSCQENDTTCPCIRKHPDEPEDVPILIAHYSYAHNARYVQNRTPVFDEGTGSTFRTRFDADDVAGYVTTYCRETPELPFDGYGEIMDARNDPDAVEPKVKARLHFDQHPPERDGQHVLDTNGQGHALAPLITYALLFGRDLGNGYEHVEFPDDRRAGAYEPDDGTVHLLLPPDLEDANNVLALDATPCQQLWRMHVYPSLRTREVLTVDEKQQFATEVNPRRIVPVKSPENPRYSVSGGNREIIDPKMDADILEKVREIEGMNPVLITGKKAIEGVYRPSEYDVLGVCKDTEWYGNMRGSNSFRNERVGVVIGSPHFGDSYIKMLGALRGKRIEQVSENRGNELDYRVVGDESDSFGNDVYRHMTEDAVYQAVMRFGRDGERTDIFVRTSKLPEWVPTVEPITVEYVPRLQSEIKSIVGSQHRDSPWWKTDEISDRIPHEPKRKIERALNELDEHGEVERDSSGGQGARWKVVDPSD